MVFAGAAAGPLFPSAARFSSSGAGRLLRQGLKCLRLPDSQLLGRRRKAQCTEKRLHRVRPGQSPRLSGLNSMLLDLQTLLRQKTAQPQPDPLDRCLNSWGLHPGIRGYEYLRYAVCLAMQSDSRLAIRKDILERVGQRYCLTSSGADCGIRRLVDYCDRLDRPAWRDFKRRREPKDQKLTTGKFIYAVKAELLWQSTRQDPSEGEPLSDERELQPV